MINQNRILRGNNGYVWVNGKLLAQITKIEAKVTGSFDDVNFVGENATFYAYTGWTGEGTLSMTKIDSTVVSLLADAFKTGVMPDVKITSKLKDTATEQSERAAMSDVVFTEWMLAAFEAKKAVEEDLPFKFSDYNVLEKIA